MIDNSTKMNACNPPVINPRNIIGSGTKNGMSVNRMRITISSPKMLPKRRSDNDITRAQWLTSEHPLSYPFGPGTPFEKLVQARGKVLLLGSDHDEVTLLHYPEHVADFPDKIVVRYRMPLLRDGKREWVAVEEFDSSNGAHASWPERFFALIIDDFIAKNRGTGLCTAGKVGDADSVLLDAAALVAFAIPIMERTARSPSNAR